MFFLSILFLVIGFYREALQQINSYVELAAAGDALVKNSEKPTVTVSTMKPGGAFVEDERENDIEDDVDGAASDSDKVADDGSGGEDQDVVAVSESTKTPNCMSSYRLSILAFCTNIPLMCVFRCVAYPLISEVVDRSMHCLPGQTSEQIPADERLGPATPDLRAGTVRRLGRACHAGAAGLYAD